MFFDDDNLRFCPNCGCVFYNLDNIKECPTCHNLKTEKFKPNKNFNKKEDKDENSKR